VTVNQEQQIPIQLARLEGKIDSLISNGSDHEVRLRALERSTSGLDRDDHEVRIRNLERWRYGLAGGLALAISPEVVSLISGGGLG